MLKLTASLNEGISISMSSLIELAKRAFLDEMFFINNL